MDTPIACAYTPAAWTFTRTGTFMFGCLVPGHWDGGMKGTIVVTAR